PHPRDPAGHHRGGAGHVGPGFRPGGCCDITVSRGLIALMVLPLTASLAFADAPKLSLLPKMRPQVAAPVGPRPRPRPQALVAPVAQAAPAAQVAPQARVQPPVASAKGTVCGNVDIKGVPLKAITSRTKACNIPQPVSITAIGGVKLVPAATINCTEAQALATWINKGLQPQFNDQVDRLLIADSTSCRPRNNVPGAKVSEHGAGNAIDISGVVLTTGKVLTVSSNFSGALKSAYKAGCGVFHTTLGPGSDGYHENHMHFDVAKNRGRPYCH
ncbi:MAG: extensin family protein, partial [Pseudorhodobacter sp.]|nr:extensin family protein [Pseudorhodobacter sp.]